jgi:eukaryotic-like serine/threonine-protein kinase
VKYRVVLISLMWFAFILVYSTFIPNTTRRGLIVMALMALAPLAIIGLQGLILKPIGEVVFWGDLITVSVSMAIAYTLGAYGMYKLGALRREAFMARQLGQYRLTEQIGSGGMGEVYLAEHQLLKRPCAIKLIRPAQSTDAKALARFEREVRLMAKLSHWNSVEVFDYGRAEDGTFYYAMEFLPGLSLQEIVERQGPLQPERAVHLLRQVCYALVEAHTIGLVHRDIKPSNIIASKRGGVFDVAKLLDFGLARSLEDTSDIKLTQEGAIAGSPFYLAPERFLENVEADVRGDVYSLGSVAYFLLTGQPPFRGDKPLKVMMAHAREEVVPPSQRNAAIPVDVEAIVLRCLAKKPDERYQDATQLERALAACDCADRWTQDMAAHWWVEREEKSELPASDAPLSPAAVGTETIS